jgi:hypothetical protein
MVEVLIGLVSLGLLLASRHTMKVLQVDSQVLYLGPQILLVQSVLTGEQLEEEKLKKKK